MTTPPDTRPGTPLGTPLSTPLGIPLDTPDVLAAVRAGRTRSLPALLKPLDRARRRDLLAGLKELRGELRADGWARWEERDRINPALLVAGAACQSGAAAAASWIGGRDMRRRRRLPYDVLVEALADRDPKWLGDLAHRLAARPSTARDDYPLISELVRRAGCPVPTTDGCVEGWATSLRSSRGTLTHALRRDPHLRAFVPRLFETPEPVAPLARECEPDDPHQWPTALAALADEGFLDRSLLLDGCTARLLRGGTAPVLKPYRAILQALKPTEEEERGRTADWIAIAADAPSSVAGHAQQVVARLAAAGHVSAGRLAEMSAAVLFRPERGLVRAQLVLLGKALARDRAAAPELLPVLGEAFGHADTDIQERALKLAAAHLGDDDQALRAELADRAHLLSPVHRARAVEAFGADAAPDEDTGPYEEFLPPPPLPVPLAPAPETVAETVELVAAVVNSRTETVEEFERALDGLVRHAHRDRTALAEALRPALADRYWLDPERRHLYTGDLPGLEHVAAAVLDVRPAARPRQPLFSRRSDCHHSDAAVVRHARVAEAAQRIGSRPLPFLLATPTQSTGALDPQVLVARLAAYARLGETPAPADFAQALLRVRRDASALPEATALGTPEGDRLANWLGEGGRPAAVTRRTMPAEYQRFGGTPDRHALDTGERATVIAEFPEQFRSLGRARTAQGRCWDGGAPETLIALLPEDRETLAAWSLPAVTSCAVDEARDGTDILPGLAASGGPAGPALHLAVATGLGARHAEDRLRAVDGLLTLAGRGELDAVRLGADLTELVDLGTVKPSRLADALRTAAATGAHATTWAVLAGLLPALLTGSADPRGTGELLETAAECVEQSRAVSPCPAGLAETAARPGRSRLVTQAARLRDALHRNGADPKETP
ncbi:DUF6493 family protein [Streptomyces sp. NPDC001903]|uniref:DUF7824 domain-containing protein n=1 Tax=Streptomyces sp. NPDC001903 TaxID=3364622 RepID=UPI00368ED82A